MSLSDVEFFLKCIDAARGSTNEDRCIAREIVSIASAAGAPTHGLIDRAGTFVARTQAMVARMTDWDLLWPPTMIEIDESQWRLWAEETSLSYVYRAFVPKLAIAINDVHLHLVASKEASGGMTSFRISCRPFSVTSSIAAPGVRIKARCAVAPSELAPLEHWRELFEGEVKTRHSNERGAWNKQCEVYKQWTMKIVDSVSQMMRDREARA